eukprot:COSAG01_NODE_36095_length_522_cov_1.056738_1_plen_120_part_01
MRGTAQLPLRVGGASSSACWRCLSLLLSFLFLFQPSTGLEFSAPQVVGRGGGASGFIGLDTDTGRLVVGSAGAAAVAVSVASLNGTSPWTPQVGANKSWPGTWPFPTECHGCRTIQTLGH